MNTFPGQGRSRRRDRGETLIELLATIMIMGIAVTAILGAVGMSITGSSRVRSDSTLLAQLRSYGETLSNVTDAGYVRCPKPTDFAAVAPTGGAAGISVSVTGVEYWDGTAYQPRTACDKKTSLDTGLQRLTLSGQDTSVTPTATATLVVYVRKPCTTNASAC